MQDQGRIQDLSSGDVGAVTSAVGVAAPPNSSLSHHFPHTQWSGQMRQGEPLETF